MPASITTPDTVQTRIGTLKFSDGLPDADSVKKVFDNLDFVRGVEAFLLGMPAASVQAMRLGFIEGGFPPNQGFGISENLADARAPFLTPNTVVVYTWAIVDVKDGPMVLQVPPGVLGILDDAHFRFVTDLGLSGPDQGKGGKYPVVPPGYTGHAAQPGLLRCETPHVQQPRHPARLHPGQRPGDHREEREGEHRDVPALGRSQSSTAEVREFLWHADQHGPRQRCHFFDELNEVVQHEPDDFLESEVVGILASIGIKKGKPFAPDARMKAILTDAAAVANATSRAIVFASRDPLTKTWSDRQWTTTFTHKSHEFLDGAERTLDARTMFYYYATGMSPAMASPQLGQGAAYCTPPATGRANGSTAARPTRSRCRPTFQPAGSGRSTCMTTRPVRSSRLTRSSPVSTARFPI